MKNSMKGLFIVIVTLILSSCLKEDLSQTAKNDFSKYYNELEEIALIHNNYIYTETSELNLESLVDNEMHDDGVLFKNDKLLFSTSEEVSIFNFTLNIYETNLKGEYIKLIFSKEGFKTNPKTYAYDDKFYIEHYLVNVFNKDSKCIDIYSINDNIYENVDVGNECSLSNYFHKEELSKYNVELLDQENDKFVIENLETGEIINIDDEYIKNTIYSETMKKYNYSPKRFDISEGHLFLTYNISVGNEFVFPHLVFEYDFNNNSLEYKLLSFPIDDISVKIVYIC